MERKTFFYRTPYNLLEITEDMRLVFDVEKRQVSIVTETETEPKVIYVFGSLKEVILFVDEVSYILDRLFGDGVEIAEQVSEEDIIEAYNDYMRNLDNRS